MSVPPPSVPPPAATPAPIVSAGPELVLALEAGRRGRRGAADHLSLSRSGLRIEHERVLRAPLELALGALKVATVDPGPARTSGAVGRFAVLRRLGPKAVIPESEGIVGWLWTSSGGSGLTSLCEDDEAPNLALVLAKPLEEALLRAVFAPDFLAALAARSPLGRPTVLGVLLRVADGFRAADGFKAWGYPDVLTDREIPPTLRRHLPTDRPADPALQGGLDTRAATSVAPPGFR